MKTLILFSLVPLLFCSCAKNFVVSYQPDSTNTGVIILEPSKPTGTTNVSINDKIVIDNKAVKSVKIDNVPEGDIIIHYTSNYKGFKKKLDTRLFINMENDKEIIQSVKVPPYKPIVYVGQVFGFLVGLGLIAYTLSVQQY